MPSQAFPHDIIRALDTWLDDHVGPLYQEMPLAQDWARLAKIAEELGEAIQVWIGLTGQNPRKRYYGTREDFYNEVCDTIITGILCLQHHTKDTGITEELLAARWAYRLAKMRTP